MTYTSSMRRVLLTGLLLFECVHAGELKFVTETLPPFNYEAAGTYAGAGPMVEVVQAVCDRIKTKCSVEVFPWRRAYAMAVNGEVDGIFSLLPTPERETLFHLSETVVESAYAFFAADSSRFHYVRPGDLDGYTVAVYGPSGTSVALEALMKGVSGARVVVEISNSMVLKKLASGRYGDGVKAVAAMNRDVGMYLARSEGISGIKPVGDFQKIAYVIGFSKKKVAESRFEEFNNALKAMIREGKVSSILDQYGLRTAR